MTRSRQYSRDTDIESMVSEFIDANFWSQLSSERAVPVRWHDRRHQFDGIDVSLSCGSGMVNFDEKAKTYGCLNQQMGVMSFELSFLNKGNQIQNGWFTQDNKTHYVMFIQLSAAVDDARMLEDASQIAAADVMWVKKSDVKDMVAEQMTKEQLEADIEELREDDFSAQLYGKARKQYPHKKFWLTYSAKLLEKPVNLVVPVDALLKLPHTKHFLVTKGKTKKI